MKETRKVSRRRALQLAATGAALPLVHIRTAGAAGKLTFAMWDHWVPTGNDAVRKVVNDWAQKNKVEVNIDFLSSNGEKINITMAAEAQARRGHDIYAFDQWTVHQWSEKLDPLDDVVASLITQYGPVAKRQRISWQGERTLDGGADQHRQRHAAALRADQHAAEIRRHRCAHLVSGASIDTGSGG